MGTVNFTIERDGQEIDLEVEYKMDGRYRPATYYRRNGDPGDPAEYPEVDIVSAMDENKQDWAYLLTSKEEDELTDKCFEDSRDSHPEAWGNDR